MKELSQLLRPRQEKPAAIPKIGWQQLITQAVKDPWAKIVTERPQDVYPLREQLELAGLTERGFLALTDLSLIPGGAASEAAVAIWQKQVEKAPPEATVHIIAAIHGATEPTVGVQGQPLSGPEENDSRWPQANIAAWETHAECSCGMAAGSTRNVRREANRNIAAFINWLAETQRKNVFVYPVEALINTDKLEFHSGEIHYSIGQSLTYRDTDRANDLLSQPSERVQWEDHNTRDRWQFAEPSGEPPKEQLLDQSEFDDWLRYLMDNPTSQIAGTACVDFRQGFTTSSPDLTAITSNELSGLLGRKDPIRDDWQTTAHTESAAVVINGSQDKKAAALAYYLLTYPTAMVRRNFGGEFFSPSSPLIVHLPEGIDEKTRRTIIRNLETVLTGIRTHQRSHTIETTWFGQPARLFLKEDDEKILEITGPAEIPVISTKSHDLKPGILVSPSLILPNQRIWPGSQRNPTIQI